MTPPAHTWQTLHPGQTNTVSQMPANGPPRFIILMPRMTHQQHAMWTMPATAATPAARSQPSPTTPSVWETDDSAPTTQQKH